MTVSRIKLVYITIWVDEAGDGERTGSEFHYCTSILYRLTLMYDYHSPMKFCLLNKKWVCPYQLKTPFSTVSFYANIFAGKKSAEEPLFLKRLQHFMNKRNITGQEIKNIGMLLINCFWETCTFLIISNIWLRRGLFLFWLRIT